MTEKYVQYGIQVLKYLAERIKRCSCFGSEEKKSMEVKLEKKLNEEEKKKSYFIFSIYFFINLSFFKWNIRKVGQICWMSKTTIKGEKSWNKKREAKTKRQKKNIKVLLLLFLFIFFLNPPFSFYRPQVHLEDWIFKNHQNLEIRPG